MTAYCIEHDMYIIPQKSKVGMCHEYPDLVDVGTELVQYGIDWCFNTDLWTATEPPEYDPDWETHLQEPDEDEMKIIEENSEGMFE